MDPGPLAYHFLIHSSRKLGLSVQIRRNESKFSQPNALYTIFYTYLTYLVKYCSARPPVITMNSQGVWRDIYKR